MRKQNRVRKIVIVFGSFVLHILSMGVSQSFGVIYKELLTAFEVSESEIGWIPSLFSGLLLGTGILAGILVSTLGVCLTSVTGSLLMTIGMVASAFVTSPYLLYLTYGVIAGCGASLLLIPASVIINEEFTERRTVAMGIASTGGSIGNVILPLFTLWCIETYQWRGSFILLGAVCLQGVIAGVLFYNGNRSKKREVVTENTTDKTEALIKSPGNRCVKYFSFFNVRYLCFVVAVTIGAVGYFIPYNLLYSMMTSKGQSNEYSSLTLSLSGVGSIVSRVLIGFAGDYKCCHRVYYLIFAVLFSAAVNVACVHLTEIWQFIAYGILYGMGTGVFAFLLSLLTSDLVGVEHVGPGFGFLVTIQGLGASIGTPAGGWLVEATGSYTGSFYFAAACFLVCGLMSLLIPLSWHCTPSHRKRYNIDTSQVDIEHTSRF